VKNLHRLKEWLWRSRVSVRPTNLLFQAEGNAAYLIGAQQRFRQWVREYGA
jgi:hypothetical protein